MSMAADNNDNEVYGNGATSNNEASSRLNSNDAIGAAFSAAILPLVNACSDGNADVMYKDLKPGNTGGSYEVVKSALESSYECLNVDCEDVGGLVDVLGDGTWQVPRPATAFGLSRAVASPRATAAQSTPCRPPLRPRPAVPMTSLSSHWWAVSSAPSVSSSASPSSSCT